MIFSFVVSEERENGPFQPCLQVHLNLACVKLIDTKEELRTTKEKCMKLELMNVLRAEQITKLEQRVNSLENRGWSYYNVYAWIFVDLKIVSDTVIPRCL